MTKRRAKRRENEIPYSTVVRLAQYLNILERLEAVGTTRISSNELSQEAKVTSFLVRKDLSYFGEFGVRGVGYDTNVLLAQLRKILGLKGERKVVLVGVGHLGRALIGYKGFSEKGFKIIGLFDSDPAKIGTTIGDMEIMSVFTLGEFVKKKGPVSIGVITVPAFSAQFVANALVTAGVRGILNFAPAPLSLPPKIICINVDLTTNLEVISYYLTHGGKP